MAVIRSLLAVTLALLLSGCAMYRLEDLRQTKPTGNAFQTALARMYMDLATQMEKGYDWVPSWHFAEKGLLLAYGHDVPPESLADWNITASDKPALSQARGELLVALTPANEAAQPEVAARPQCMRIFRQKWKTASLPSGCPFSASATASSCSVSSWAARWNRHMSVNSAALPLP